MKKKGYLLGLLTILIVGQVVSLTVALAETTTSSPEIASSAEQKEISSPKLDLLQPASVEETQQPEVTSPQEETQKPEVIVPQEETTVDQNSVDDTHQDVDVVQENEEPSVEPVEAQISNTQTPDLSLEPEVAEPTDEGELNSDFTYADDAKTILEKYNGTSKDVVIPDGVVTILASAFSTKGLTSVSIPEGVASIAYHAFSNNELTSVTIPTSASYIGDSAFSNNKLTSVTILSGEVFIWSNAFSNQTAAKELVKKTSYSFEELGLSYAKGGTKQPLNLIGESAGIQIDNDQKVIRLDSTSINEFIVSWKDPNNVHAGTLTVKLGDGYTVEFDSNGGNPVASQTVEENGLLTKPTDPQRLNHTFLGWYTDETFETKFDFNSPVTKNQKLVAKWELQDEFIYSDEGKTILKQYNGTSRDVVIPDGVRTIEASVFRSKRLKSVTIPNSVTIIEQYAFSYNDLKSVTIPNKETFIGNQAFANNQLSSVTILNKEGYTHPTAFFNQVMPNIELLKKASYSFDELGLSFIKNGAKQPLILSSLGAGINIDNDKKTITLDNTNVNYFEISWNDPDNFYNGNLKVNLNGYTVEFDSNEGNAVASQTVVKGSLFEEPEAPTRTGYSFEGWYKDKELNKVYDFTTIPNDNLKLYAKWKKDLEKYTISFEANGGSKVAGQTVTQGESVQVPIKPTRKDYTFEGWYTDKELKTVYNFDSIPTGSFTLYAKWEEDEFIYSDEAKTILKKYNGASKDVVIPDGVVTISNRVFASKQLTSVTIPKSVTSIENSAFANNRLTSVTIPENVTSVEEYAFYGNQLTNVTIPKGVTDIKNYAFAVNHLASVTIPESVISIGNSAFIYNHLTSVTIPKNVISIGQVAFYGNHLTSVIILNSETFIGHSAFDTQIPNIELLKKSNYSFEELGLSYTKAGTKQLLNLSSTTVGVEIDNDQKVIRLDNTSTNEFNISWSEPSDGYSGTLTVNLRDGYTVDFDSNEGNAIVSQIVEKGSLFQEPETPTRAGYIFEGWYKDKGLNEVYDFTTISTGNLTLYAKWKEDLEQYTISFETNGGSKVIEQTVTEGEPVQVPTKPTRTDYTFEGWYTDKELKTVYDFDSIPIGSFTLYAKWKEDEFIYADDAKTILKKYNGTNKDVVIPEGVITINSRVFVGKQLTSVTIPESVISIGDYAFYSNQLTSVTIPKNVESIGAYAFSTNQLSSVIIPENVTSIGKYAFFINQLSSVTIPESVTSIGDAAFSFNQLSSVTIPKSVTSIGAYAFYSNQLTNVTIPDKVEFIGNFAFYANKLTNVTIPESVTFIGEGTFTNNQLTSVTIPENVTSIGEYAFYGNQLTSVNILNSKTSIGRFALDNQKPNIELLKKTSYSFEELGLSYTKASTKQLLNLITSTAGVQIDEVQKVIRLDSTSINEFKISWSEPISGYSGNLTVKLRDGYTVDFNSNEGSDVLSQTIEKGSLFKEPETPTRVGYTFEGWYADEELKTVYDFDTIPTGSFTLYAKWKKDLANYTVSFEVNGGSEVLSQIVVEEQVVEEPTKPTRTGYTFSGWYTDKELTEAYNFETVVTNDFTLYAKWEKEVVPEVSYTVSFDSLGGSEINSLTVVENNKIAKPTNPTRLGYIFEGWCMDKELTEVYDFETTVTSDFTLYAKWRKEVVPEVSYTVSFDTLGGSEINSLTVVENNKIAKPTNPTRLGYIFEGWCMDKELTEVYDFETTVTSDLTLYAKWEKEVVPEVSYKVSFDTLGGNEINPLTVLENKKVAKPANPTKVGYKFLGWYTDKELNKAYDFETVVTSNFTLYAKWEQEVVSEVSYTVSFDTLGGNEINPLTVLENKKVSKPADPTRVGYKFLGWYADKELTEAYDFETKVTSNFTLYAKWEKISVIPVITKPTVTEPKPNQTLANGKGNSKVTDKSLPKTGEETSLTLVTLGGFLLVASLYVVNKQRKRQDEI